MRRSTTRANRAVQPGGSAGSNRVDRRIEAARWNLLGRVTNQHLVRSESGELVHCIQDPDGKWVPDVRGPGFRPPSWATLPACLEESLAARNAGTRPGPSPR